jgi:hypothetical protein
MSTYSAKLWNEWMKIAARAFPRRGRFCQLQYTTNGIIVSASPDLFWRHPWSMRLLWEIDEEDPDDEGGWSAFVWPGFVNGRDVAIARVSKDAPDEQTYLTDENPAGLRMSWRNPLTSAGISATLDGEIVAAPGEGYPRFFETIGVKPAAKGGNVFEEPDALDPSHDEFRVREIRACDVFLVTPRIATILAPTVLNPFTDSQSIRFDTIFDNTYFRNAPARHRLLSTPKWTPPLEPTQADRLFGVAVEPQTDEILIGTVWIVSPGEATSEDEPDESWEAYVQYKVFWNLAHASKSVNPGRPHEPITLNTGLAFGIADTLFSALLSPINDFYNRVQDFFREVENKGRYWTV